MPLPWSVTDIEPAGLCLSTTTNHGSLVMTNAGQELRALVIRAGAEVEYVETFGLSSDYDQYVLYLGSDLSVALDVLDDYEYDSGYGTQKLFGTVWFKDGTWATRNEYDGSEHWKRYKRPELPGPD